MIRACAIVCTSVAALACGELVDVGGPMDAGRTSDSSPDSGPSQSDSGRGALRDDASSEAGTPSTDATVCMPGTQECSGSRVKTCGAQGQWSPPWSCTTGVCSDGGCTGSTSTGQSCLTEGAGLTDCGASQESCCTSLEVPGGTYFRTYTNSGMGPTGEEDPATVSGLRIDKYLVTVGRFRQFVNAWIGGYAPPAGSGKHTHLNSGQGLVYETEPGTYETGWDATDWNNTTYLDPTNINLACEADTITDSDTWTTTAGDQENLPINCVTWYEANAFCIWDGGFLPSEAEWEYVAAGGTEEREYPWGAAAPGTKNQYAIDDGHYTANSTNIAPVGTATAGAGLWGQLDLAGELWEWTLDWFSQYSACTDCAELGMTVGPFLGPFSDRVIRGGDFSVLNASTTDLSPPFRYQYDPSGRVSNVGFRCARAP
jgi:formylglycine-generating enzyme